MWRFCFIVSFFFIHQQVTAQIYPACQQALLVLKAAEKHHYQPRDVDDDFSELVFSNYLDAINPNRTLLTQHERNELEGFKNKLDDEILHQQCTFLDRITNLYKKQLLFTDSLLQTLRHERLNFSESDSLHLEDATILHDHTQLVGHWKKYIKFQILLLYLSTADSLELQQNPSPEVLFELQQSIVEQESCRIAPLINDEERLEEYLSSTFLKALSSALDPHSIYFTPSEETEFEAMLSKEVLAYGLQLAQNEKGEIEISQLIPGSPAWKSNTIAEGDVILSITTPQGVVQNLNCRNLESTLQLLSSQEVNELSFQVRKQNHTSIEVTLFKEKVTVAENVISSFILKDELSIGYIALPAFYTHAETDTYGSNGCANDLAKELIKLKHDNIDGLIIDLRNNSGGSMLEAIRLAGIFINYGALAILHSRDESPVTLKDMDRGTIYDGPLVILVNAFSASASELFAAALQDHHRALIVGSTTFGKSTAQEILPLNESQQSNKDGYLKLTMSKFYRVTGKSLQQTGVIPDVKLPDLYDNLSIGERMYPSSLSYSTIEKKTYYYPYAPLPIEQLQTLSTQRVKHDSTFAHIKKQGSLLSAMDASPTIPLDYKSVKSFYTNTFIDRPPTKTKAWLEVSPPYYLEESRVLTKQQSEMQAQNIEQISADVHIQESYNILSDLIKLNQNSK